MEHIGLDKVKTYWTPEELQLIGYQPYQTQLVVYHIGQKSDGERLAWMVIARPKVMRRLVYFVDATTGDTSVMINYYNDVGVFTFVEAGTVVRVRNNNDVFTSAGKSTFFTSQGTAGEHTTEDELSCAVLRK